MRWPFLLLAVIGVFLFSAPAGAVPPHVTLNLQIFEPADPFGFSYDGPLEVALFDAPEAGVLLWHEVHDEVLVEHGYLSVAVGVGDATFAQVLAEHESAPLYLEVIFPGTELPTAPRMEVTSAPFALSCEHAHSALRLQELGPDDLALVGHLHSIGELWDWPEEFPPAAHEHPYLPLDGMAADAARLEGHEAAHFAAAASVTDLSDKLVSGYYDRLQLEAGALDARYAPRAEEEAKFQPVGPYLTLTDLKTMTGLQELSDEEFVRDLGNMMTGACPPGYNRVADEAVQATGYFCRKPVGGGRFDEVVKVGDVWVDRFELSLWEFRDCTGALYGLVEHDAHEAGFARNGTDITNRLYACSVRNAVPAGYITWFQAQQACRDAGKRLCTNAEWQAAASGTDDRVGDLANAQGYCHVNLVPNEPSLPGSRLNCVSYFGTYDMVGNMWEWVAEWFGQGEDFEIGAQSNKGEYHGDGFWNVDPAQDPGGYPIGERPHLPAVAIRGGEWSIGTQAGVFTIDQWFAPSAWNFNVGARCCMH